jgi:predicted transcriptional regulator
MRTTIRIDDDLHSEAKALAASTGRTLSQVVEDALRESLARSKAQSSTRGQPRGALFQGKGLRAGVDLDQSAEIFEDPANAPRSR